MMDKKRRQVEEFYSEAAAEPKAELCCPTAYEGRDLDFIPERSREVSYGCGAPVLQANLKEGERVLDLGCGAGIDCFIAARIVGKCGSVVGVDMTEEMLVKARESAPEVSASLGYANVEFKRGFLEALPLSDSSIDLVVSNCVINLSADKGKVFREIFRVLDSASKGARFCISDVVADGVIPEEMAQDKRLWGECLSGALSEAEFLKVAKEAGFYSLSLGKKNFYKEVSSIKFYSVTITGYKVAGDKSSESNGAEGEGACCVPLNDNDDNEGSGCC
jgi:ubiquinone/menaquinone biosynthesis C-methylase UbiE